MKTITIKEIKVEGYDCDICKKEIIIKKPDNDDTVLLFPDFGAKSIYQLHSSCLINHLKKTL